MDAISQVIAAIDHSQEPARDVQKAAVRTLLERLATSVPGNSVEVRVPPFGAVQCVAGPRHRRGTPANVVESDPVTFLHVALGRMTFAEAVASGKITASGARSDLSEHFPLLES
ncbi:sterol carrier family protein [Natronoglycomyces albus]|uniref:Bacterial SCP orthologue domain-containing protein n=1 Tax=Natronoglycomyces albus TaxID=2811108 RepID=A0A895XIZ1_9ACTN|nr:sterol carrier family protein [Natronoglycomyces albus]QSB05304.1 hypothetical protein JQS30_16400 [Natronoglycomyces albus]